MQKGHPKYPNQPFTTLRSVVHTVARLVAALRCRSAGCESDCRWCYLNFSWTYSFQSWGVDSAFKINEYQEYFLGGKDGR
jgi:hypothetical protein